MPSMKLQLWVFLCTILLASCRRKDWAHGRSKTLAVAVSEFAKDSDGWTLEIVEGREHLPDPVSVRASLQVSDSGSSLWYFVAPPKFSGNLLVAYNGALSFKLWHPTQPTPGTPPAARSSAGPDVILGTGCGFDLVLYNIIAAPTITPQVYFIPIYEEAAEWIDSRTRRRVRQLDFLEALSHVTSLRIRGGFFTGSETVQLGDVRIVPASQDEFSGRAIRPCCSPAGAVVQCISEGSMSVPGAFRYSNSSTPPSLTQFECGGSRIGASQRPRIDHVYPRTSRRNGGTKITVFGENFGLDGTSALRVGGQEGQCTFYRAQHCTNGFTDYDEENVDCGGQNCPVCSYVYPHCEDGVLNLDEEKIDCGGANCAACKIMNLSAHCSNGILDFDEEAPDIGGADCLPGFCFDTRLAGDKTDRLGNCGGSCQPCDPSVMIDVAPGTEYTMAVCRTPAEKGEGDVGVSFIRRDDETEFQSCGYDNEQTRGFVYGGFGAEWAAHWASLEDAVINDVNVTNMAVDIHSGETYVTATVTKTQDSNTGKNGVMGKQMHKDAFYEPGFGGVGSEDEIILENEAAGNSFDSFITYTALLKLDKLGRVAWLTYMESQYVMVATDILVDNMAAVRRIMIAGHYKGHEPRFYQVNPETRKARRGPTYGDGISCPDPDAVQDVGQCHYHRADPVYSSPLDPSAGSQQLTKVGLFLVTYTPEGVAKASRGGMYFQGTASFIRTDSVRIAAHSTAPPAPGVENGTVGSGLEGSSGLYLACNVVSSRYGDTLFVGEQAKGYQYLNPCKGGTIETINGTDVCVGGTPQDRDVLSIRFPAQIPTPDNELGFVLLAKFVATDRHIGSVWARLIGEVGFSDAANFGGIAADQEGVYITGSFTSGVVGNLSFQSCPFNERMPECEVGGAWFSRATQECILQTNYRRAPAQVCASVYIQTLPRHLVVPTLPQHSEVTGSLFVAAYTGGGELRWNQRAMGGSLSVRALALIPRDRGKYGLGEGMVYVAGQVDRIEDVDGTVLYSNFGQPRSPSRAPATLQGRVTGMSLGTCDIFLAQYAAADGELQWVRRLGQRDAQEEVEGMTAVPTRNSVILVGTFWGTGTVAEDVFGLGAVNRNRSIGCSTSPVGKPTWDSALAEWVVSQEEGAGLPDCLLRTLGPDATGATGFLVEVGEGDGESSVPGGNGRPHSECLTEAEAGCNADGVVWARTIGRAGSAGLEGSPQSYGAAVTAFRGGVMVGGRFSGVLRSGRATTGLTVEGVDEQDRKSVV